MESPSSSASSLSSSTSLPEIPGGTEPNGPIPEAPPVDNDHVAEGCEPFVEPSPVTMRAKLQVSGVQDWDHPEGIHTPGQTITMFPVGGDKVQHGYPEDGTDEDNTFSHWTPSGALSLGIVNPNLIGKFKDGQKFYVDFTEATGPRMVNSPEQPAEQPAELPPIALGGELAPATPHPEEPPAYSHLELRAMIMEEIKRLNGLLNKSGAITIEDVSDTVFKRIVAYFL